MTELLNLDARRAEVLHTPHKVQLGGVVYEIPAELPILFAEYLTAGQFRAALEVLFGADAVDTVAPLISKDDLAALCEVYQVTAPE